MEKLPHRLILDKLPHRLILDKLPHRLMFPLRSWETKVNPRCSFSRRHLISLPECQHTISGRYAAGRAGRGLYGLNKQYFTQLSNDSSPTYVST